MRVRNLLKQLGPWISMEKPLAALGICQEAQLRFDLCRPIDHNRDWWGRFQRLVYEKLLPQSRDLIAAAASNGFHSHVKQRLWDRCLKRRRVISDLDGHELVLCDKVEFLPVAAPVGLRASASGDLPFASGAESFST